MKAGLAQPGFSRINFRGSASILTRDPEADTMVATRHVDADEDPADRYGICHQQRPRWGRWNEPGLRPLVGGDDLVPSAGSHRT